MEVSKELIGAKTAVQNMLFYYYMSMVNAGYEDPRQAIATEMASMIDLSSDQLDYVIANLAEDRTIYKAIETSISLLKKDDETENNQLVIKLLTEVINSMDNIYNELIVKEMNG